MARPPTAEPKMVAGGATTYYIGDHYEIKNGVATKYIFAGSRRIAKRTGDQIYYYHKDHLGSSTVMEARLGGTVESTDYLPFGSQREQSGASVTDYKFTDQELDPSTGLYNYDARLYDPVIGRFISPDSIIQNLFDPQMLNRYSYVRNNPLAYTDPSGHVLDIAVQQSMLAQQMMANQMAASAGSYQYHQQNANQALVRGLTKVIQLMDPRPLIRDIVKLAKGEEDIEDETKSKTQLKKEEKRRKKQEQSEPKDEKAVKDKSTKEKKKLYQEQKDDLDYQIEKGEQIRKRKMPGQGGNKTEQNIERIIDDYEK